MKSKRQIDENLDEGYRQMAMDEAREADDGTQTKPVNVSLISLIADPERFRGRLVRVIGYLEFAFEGDALYVHSEDALLSISANAVYVDATQEMHGNRNTLGSCALLEAIFDPDQTGHRGVFCSGGLVQVQRCESWPPKCLRRESPA